MTSAGNGASRLYRTHNARIRQSRTSERSGEGAVLEDDAERDASEFRRAEQEKQAERYEDPSMTPAKALEYFKQNPGISDRDVAQYMREYNVPYKSISEASRESGEPEHRIRAIAKGKKKSKAEYKWKFKDEKETKEYSEKYSKI